MSKNIILCLDGTGNQFSEDNSNVVKLYSVLDRTKKQQISYYDPGVGTLGDSNMPTFFAKQVTKILGLAFGYGLKRNIFQAYSYLMENYRDGDKIYVFGFSRGAYTARVLISFIHMIGLLGRGCQNLLPYAYKLFSKKNFELSAKFKKIYSQSCQIHFLGVWDTVSSIGWATFRKSFPYTKNPKNISIIRHAVAIDERRAYYRTNLFEIIKPRTADIKEIWFAGVHSDVGGSYPEAESGLSKIPLQWMVDEAVIAGLVVNKARCLEIVEGNHNDYVSPDYKAQLHKSLTWPWWILEIIPKNGGLDYSKWHLPLAKRRPVHQNAEIHQSAIDRRDANDVEYSPENLP